MLRGVLWGAPTPRRSDPSRLIQTPAANVELNGRLLSDVRRFPSGCSVLLEVDRIEALRVEGRTELQLPDCSAPLLQGWRVHVTGVLRRPMRGAHLLSPGSAERLARQGSWSQLRVEAIELLQRPWTPLADLRRAVSQRLQQAVGTRRGGVLAALVLGSAQVQLPEDIREAFRIAGLSYALAASGFHLSVLPGSVLVLGLLPWLLGAERCCRRWSLLPMAVRSCQVAQRLTAVHGHARLDWAMILDSVATDVLPCWQELAHRVEASQQGRAPIAIGQVLRSTGLAVLRLQHPSRALLLRVGRQRW